MIDHVSISVGDLEQATRFYEAVTQAIGYKKLRAESHAVGFGKTYPEFWINRRQHMTALEGTNGAHVALRAASADAVDAFHAAALAAGGQCDGEPGLRPQYCAGYYAAFIRDPDGNRIEVVTFLAPAG